MASKKQPASSGSGSDGCGGPVMDDRKRKRMLSNRESARRSRMKKQKLLEDFVSQVSQLQAENRQLEQQINGATENYIDIDSANSVLRAQLMELTDRLRSLNSLLQVVEEVSGFAIDIPEIPDSLLNPWQMPCPATASAHHCLCSSHT